MWTGGFNLFTYYYFSTNKYKTVYMLTLENVLKFALKQNDVIMAVCNKFTTDEMLTNKNSQTGRFELNETIISTLNK